jgi:hypothetical protein
MAYLKLKKKSWLRRRFIKSPILDNLEDWSDCYLDLKRQILTTSSYQMVGGKRIIEIDGSSGSGRILIEVVGVPNLGFDTIDVPPRDVLTWDSPESLFEVDFLALKQEAEDIIQAISGLKSSSYHIVLEGSHLSLHFFI